MLAPVYHGLNPLDLALAAFLVVGFPLLQRTSAIMRRRKPETSLIRRYLRSSIVLGVPLLLLAIDWIGTGRGAPALGLDLPPSFRGVIGLGVAVLVILALFGMTLLQPVPADPGKRLAMARRLRGGGLLPDSPYELRAAFAYALVVGCGSELLFRAFLLWFFIPLAGFVGAVVIAALAYGLGQGARNRRDVLIAILAAAAFTAAYAFTFSLWWLMAIHTAAAMQGSWAGYRLAHAGQPR